MASYPRRGFASMPPEQRRAIASKGGKAVQAAGLGHRFTSESGREAGRKGGQTTGNRIRLALALNEALEA